MVNTHDELKELNQRKQNLIRQLDRKEIEFSKYCIDINAIEDTIKEKIKNKIEQNAVTIKQREENEIARSGIMPDATVKKDKVKKVGTLRGPKSDSYASVILEVLQKKTIKSVEAAADAVLEKKPGRDKPKVKSQIIVMINEVKKGKKPAYTWDADNFQLNVKQ